MCGRYSLALRPSQVRAYLENNDMQVYDAPGDEDEFNPRQSFNFAPGYNGIVYRADTPDRGAGPRSHKHGEDVAPAATEEATQAQEDEETDASDHETRYKLQSMKWGLVPFWTKRNPDYGSLMRTINCRDDSLIENRGMWTSMKQKKRCIVVAQGIYEWLKKNDGKERIPHYIKRKDGKLMCMAGLWDCVQYEGSDEKLYTYTIITTDSNAQMKFLHDRMPVILDNGSEEMKTWLDPKRHTWSKELQSLLKPYKGELEIYPVSKEVGKVGNNSPNFIVPIDSSQNKNNIANFFGNAKGAKSKASPDSKEAKEEVEKKKEQVDAPKIKHEAGEDRKTVDHSGTEDNAPLPIPEEDLKRGVKRHLDDVVKEEPESKSIKISESRPSKRKPVSPVKTSRTLRSSTSNGTAPADAFSKKGETPKITNFFKK